MAIQQHLDAGGSMSRSIDAGASLSRRMGPSSTSSRRRDDLPDSTNFKLIRKMDLEVRSLDHSVKADAHLLAKLREKQDLTEVVHKVYFDIEIDIKYAGRIVMGLFGKSVPKTAAAA